MNKNKIIYLPLLIIILLTSFSIESQAQRKKKSSKVDEYFDESGGWQHRLWFGGSINPGFVGGNGTSIFFLGVSPMIGVKILENDDRFSIGPRGSFRYTYEKFFNTVANDFDAIQYVSYSVGAFARYKVFPRIFPHVEIEFENAVVDLAFNGSDVETVRATRQNLFVGAGYNSGGLLGYEILVLFNVNEPTNSSNLPFETRFGLTYKF